MFRKKKKKKTHTLICSSTHCYLQYAIDLQTTSVGTMYIYIIIYDVSVCFFFKHFNDI